MKVYFFDIETSANLAFVWEKYEQDVISFEKERELLCFSFKELGKKEIKTYSKENLSALALTKKLWEVFNEADVLIGQNCDEFDCKMANAFFAHLGLKPPSNYKTIDTLKIARKKFRFNSNKLDDLGEYLGCGRKAETGGFKLWLGCLKGNKKSWQKMRKYNKVDVLLLEKVYNKLKPWVNTAEIAEAGMRCPACGSNKIQKRGWLISKVFKRQRYQCRSCGRWSSSSNIINQNI